MSSPYQCCFCGVGIESVAPDVASLQYTTCIDGKLAQQRSQEIFCHTSCLIERLHASVPRHALTFVDPTVARTSATEHPPSNQELAIVTASPFDREKLVDEIWMGDSYVGEITHEPEDASPMVTIYPRKSGEPWVMPLNSLLAVLQHVRRMIDSEN